MAAEPAELIRTSSAATVPMPIVALAADAAADLAALRRLSVRRRPLPWRHVVPRAVALWLATRLIDVVLTVLFTSGDAFTRLLHWWFWDARFYGDIAKHGYVPNHPELAAFFPLYPLLLHPLQGPWMLERLLADLAVSNLGTLLAFVLVGLFAAHEARDPRAAYAPMLLLAVSPLAVFLAGAYTDGLFIALVAWALLAARRGRWQWAAVAVTLATLTRPFGLLLIPALLIEMASQRAWWWRLRATIETRSIHHSCWRSLNRRELVEIATVTLLPLFAFGGFLLVLWRQYGDPLITPHAEATVFGHAFRWPWQTVALAVHQIAVAPLFSYRQTHVVIDLLPPLTCLALALLLARRQPAAFTVYTVLVVVVCFTSPVIHALTPNAVVSDGRYCYAAVPVVLWLAERASTRRWVLVSLASVSLALQVWLTVFVLHGGWLV